MMVQRRLSLLSTLLALVAGASPALAKDLYLTVRRDFSPKENPVVEVNYKSAAPITFRLLKPKDMKGFIASQIDLRRAWKEPKVEVNTANPLISGVNRLNFSVDWIRSAVDQEMRKGLIDTFGGGRNRGFGSNLSAGPEKLISAPENFQLVKEFSLEPKEADKERPFDVPGFDWWSGYSLSTRMIELPQIEPGFYVLQTVQGRLEGQVVVVVNDIQASLQQTDGAAIVRATTRSGLPLKDAAVSIRDLNGKWVADKKTDANGIVEFNGIKSTELIAVVEGNGTAIIDTEFFSTVGVSEDLYLYSDRPMYKPGDSVSFKGILREPRNGVSRLTGAKNVRVALASTEGATVGQSQDVRISEYGTFSGAFTLKEGDSGLYRLVAEVETKEHIGEIRVKDYVKPIFFAKLNTTQETLRPGATLKAKLKVERYAGGAPKNASYRLELYRVRLESPKWIDDAGLGESGNKVTYGFDAASLPDVSIPELLLSQDPKALPRNGEASLSLQIPANAAGNAKYDYKYMVKITVTDEDGNGATTSKSFLDMKAEILAQSQINASFAGSEYPAVLKARAVYPSGKPYMKTKGKIEWKHQAYKGRDETIGTAEFETDANGRYEVKVPVEKAGRVTALVALADRNGVEVQSESSIIVLPPKLGEGVVQVDDLTLMTRKTMYAPGETASVLLLFPEGWGENRTNKGRVYLTVAGDRIFEQRAINVEGLSTFVEQKISKEYGTSVFFVLSYSDPVKGWVERMISYVIPPADKILNLSVRPELETTLPGSEQNVFVKVADNRGAPIRGEVSISVVDRAVLDLQPEFRPSLIEFFYPVGRLNLMSFFSTQFQSYGYGEQIARLFKPNHWFSATKAPPDRLVEKDTAFWTGHAITDDKGEAKVSFRLPANQTIWQVTAVAVDKEGRFGEGTAEFKANSPVQTILAMPQFLRLGDQGQVRLTVANQDRQREHKVKYALALPAGAQLDTPISVERVLKAGEEFRDSRQMRIEAVAEGGRLKFNEDVDLDGRKLAFEQEIKTMTNKAPSVELLSLSQAAEIDLKDDETVSAASVTVTSGFMGAVLPAVRWLVHYPHGCVEQTTNQTVPNLVLAGLFEETLQAKAALKAETGAFPRLIAWVKNVFVGLWDWLVSLFRGQTIEMKLSKRYEKLITDARDYGQAGLTRLAGYQNADGSFAWFEDGGDSNTAMTMFVLMSLLSTENANWAKTVDIQKAFNHLTYKGYDKDEFAAGSLKKIVLAYLSGRMKALNLSDGSSESYLPNLKLQAEKAAEGDSALAKAYMLLALKDHGIKLDGDFGKPAQKMLVDLASDLQDALSKGQAHEGSWRLASTAWQEYMGRDASNVAVVSRALQAYGKLEEPTIQNVVRFLMKYFNGSNFGSTFETGQVLAHSAWILKRELQSRDSVASLKVQLNGSTLDSDDFDVVTDVTGWDVAIKPALLKPGKNTVMLQNSDKFLASALRVVRDVPMERAQASSEGWTLEKKLFRVDEKNRRLDPLDGAQVKVGDTLYVEVSFKRTARPNAFESVYYTLKDDIPAGTSVIEEDKELLGMLGKQAFGKDVELSKELQPVRKLHADHVRWYFQVDRGWMDRADRVGYFLRADFAGDYTAGVARIEDFYDDRSFAQTKAARVAIAPFSP